MGTRNGKKKQDEFYYCPGCGAEGDLRYDKKKRPFWRCPFCGIITFFGGGSGLVGFQILQSVIRRNPHKFREAIFKRMAQDRRRRRSEDVKKADKPAKA